MQEVNMEYAPADEAWDMGTECFGYSGDFDTLVSLYGDVGIYLSAYETEEPLDYLDAMMQEDAAVAEV
jgi:hypothetical protein